MVKSLPAICLLFWSQLAFSANQVTAVSANGGSVTIAANAPPNFTTFTMSGPPRLVVDLAETTFQGVAPDIAVNQGDIVSIKTLNYGTGASAVARIMITYGKEIDTDIITSGNSIVVRPSTPGPSMQEQPASAPTPTIAGGSGVPPPAAPSTSPPPAAGDSPAPPSPPSRDEIATEAPPTEKVQTEAQHTTAYAQVEPTTPPPPAPAWQPTPAGPAAGGAPPTTDAQAPAQPATAAAEPPAQPAERSQADEAASPTPPAATGEVKVSGRKKRLELVGLRFNGSPAVFIRTNEPVHYTVRDHGTTLVVVIENTHITRRNDTRPLDVHFFDSPISTVRAHQDGRNVEVEIDLKSQSPFQTTQAGKEVQLTFSK